MSRYVLALFLTIQAGLSAAQTIQGKVVDAENGEPMAFVNLQIRGTTTGTMTGVDGKFVLNASTISPNTMVDISFVGYETRSFAMGSMTGDFVIRLKPAVTALKEVVFEAGENPAHGIIRKVQAAKEVNDPKNLNAYTFNCYNKTIYTAAGLDDDSVSADTMIAKTFRQGHLLMMESYSEVKRIRGNPRYEKVLKSKFSGWDDPKFAMLSSTFQPFSFYDDQINFFGTDFINPIGDGSLRRYDFFLADTLYSNDDTTYVMTFEPIRKIEFKTLKGVLYVNTNGYAIENIIASPADQNMKIDFVIQQQYERVEGKWFPKVLYTKYLPKESGLDLKRKNADGKVTTTTIPLVLKNQSFISNVRINPLLVKKDLGTFNVAYTQELRDSSWNDLRAVNISPREAQTYYNYDTLNNKSKKLLNGMLNATTTLAGGTIPIGKISLLPNHLIRLNEYERVALGIGMTTNEKFSKVFQFNGYGMYGFRDKAAKYGGGMTLHLNRDKGLNFSAQYSRDLSEPGQVSMIRTQGVNLSASGDMYRRLVTSRMDSVESIRFEFNSRPSRNIRMSLFANRENRNPAYAYQYTSTEPMAQYTIAETGVQLRYLRGEQLMKMGPAQIITGHEFPFINMRLSHAASGLANSNVEFTRADLIVKHQSTYRGTGKTTWSLYAAQVWGNDVPYSYLILPKAVQFEQMSGVSLYAPGYLQTMGIYEFVSDRYAQLGIEHNFGPLFQAMKGYMQPELVLVHQMAYGTLSNPARHEGIEIKTLDKGYFESGILFNNLLRMDAKLYWLGYGAGVFYRYGANELPRQRDNLTFVLNTSIKF